MSHKTKKALLEKVTKLSNELPLYREGKPVPKTYIPSKVVPAIEKIVPVPTIEKTVIVPAPPKKLVPSRFKVGQPHGNNF